MANNEAFDIQDENLNQISQTVENDRRLSKEYLTKQFEPLEIQLPPPNTPSNKLTYSIEDVPPWYLCIFLGFQHFLTMFGSTISIPYLLSPYLCIGPDDPARAYIISTIIFVSGIITFLQATFGVRLPIIQGGTFSFLIPTFAILSLPEWKCPSPKNVTYSPLNISSEIEDVEVFGSDEVWHRRIREIQGAIICSSLFPIVIASSGMLGFLLKFITPLSVMPVITLVGMSLVENAANMASKNWLISMLTVVLMILFSQYLKNINIPCAVYTPKEGCQRKKFPLFNLFPVLLSLAVTWILCIILTQFNVFGADDAARTDHNLHIIQGSPWFRVPYPGQWGLPTVSLSAVLGMLGGVLASTVESVGDYYACARLSGAPRPPTHAVNRGILIEGFGTLLAGLWGSGNGTTSYGENIGVIGVTKVASRRVIQAASIIMLITGSICKFGALFVTIPDPIIGGIFFIMFSIVSGVGLSNLQFVDLNSSRNLFVAGFPIFVGLAVPKWLQAHPDAINTGNRDADNIIIVLLTTSMFVGGILGIFLDNTIPGSEEERGLIKWKAEVNNSSTPAEISSCYDLPFGMGVIRRSRVAKFIPISPTFDPNSWIFFRRKKADKELEENVQVVKSIS